MALKLSLSEPGALVVDWKNSALSNSLKVIQICAKPCAGRIFCPGNIGSLGKA